ncbi:MAG: NAD-dependent epimerase/dehydratase family protein [Cyclobacteriaceae bacterium]
MERIFITGVTGFIGHNLVQYFNTQQNFQLFGHSRDSAKARVQLKGLPVELIETYSAKVFDERSIDTVIHLAGIAHDLSNQYKPDDYYRVNFENTKVVFDEFVKSSAKKFIFLSSIKAAVDISSREVDESVEPIPVTDYGKSKRKAEEYIQSIQLSNNRHAYIFRPCMIHGSGNKGNLNLLYRFAKTGLPYPFGAFNNQRSFLTMDNLSFVFESFLAKDIPSGIFHLADEGFLSTTELYKLISFEIGKKPRVWPIPSGLIQFFFSLIGKRATLNKLTEDMMVSNKKLLRYIGQPLPIEMREGLKKTIRSFHGA